MSDPSPDPSQDATAKPRQYTVIARRYRPQRFEELIGQEHVAQALMNAITTKRVGHAYLFTGARGVGKTSAARILAKALNCQTRGPTPSPCNQCDICGSVGLGDDVDVLEIDGASNRGIDEIRQLRQNVSVRPSRARFKIYIIDEVHMLTREAFNALLKTLEEPPGHVKFIFCTTEPTKIPITILSRCQRFDFAGIRWDSVAQCLRKIVDAEGIAADPEALQILARRAAGSMRDAQSLLEQLLAFSPERIGVADVHGLLGSAGEERLVALAGHLIERDPAAALADLDTAVRQGVDVAQLLEQLFGHFRDCMAAKVGCPPEVFLHASPGAHGDLVKAADRLGLETILAIMQVLEQTLSRLRFSTQARILAELALVRICGLDSLDDLATLIARLQSSEAPEQPAPVESGLVSGGSAPSGRPERTPKAMPLSGGEPEAPAPDVQMALTPQNAADVWNQALSKLSGLLASPAKDYSSAATPAPNRLVIGFKPAYTLAKSICEKPEHLARLEQALAEVTGEPVKVEFTLVEDELEPGQPAPSTRAVSPQQRIREISRHPMIRRAADLFGARPTDVVDPPEG